MKRKNINFIIFILTLLIFLPLSVLAIGQTTEPILIDNALRGSGYTKTLTLLNSADEEVIYELKGSGEIASWVSFFSAEDKAMETPITEINVPAGLYLNLTAKFIIPDDAANKEYKGQVLVVYTPEVATTSDQKSANLSQSVGRQVTINVSDEELIDIKASVIPEAYDVKPGDSFSIRVIYDNQSNVAINPQIDLKIKNSEQTFYSAIFPYPDSAEAVKPGTQFEISKLTIPTNNIAPGKYIAELKFMQGGDEALAKNFTFNIGSADAAAVQEPGNDNIKKINASLIFYAIGVLLVIIIGFLVKISLKKNKRTKNDHQINLKGKNNSK